MYTPTGTVREAAAFIHGYVSGAALCSAYREPLDEWYEFEDWIRRRLKTSSTPLYILAEHPDGLQEFLRLLTEYTSVVLRRPLPDLYDK
jgi:hypothetical protein